MQQSYSELKDAESYCELHGCSNLSVSCLADGGAGCLNLPLAAKYTTVQNTFDTESNLYHFFCVKVCFIGLQISLLPVQFSL